MHHQHGQSRFSFLYRDLDLESRTMAKTKQPQQAQTLFELPDSLQPLIEAYLDADRSRAQAARAARAARAVANVQRETLEAAMGITGSACCGPYLITRFPVARSTDAGLVLSDGSLIRLPDIECILLHDSGHAIPGHRINHLQAAQQGQLGFHIELRPGHMMLKDAKG